ncbi:MAG TPA: DUF192 domain-containing protein [Steroidobacteraceae bacterium]|jgi:hypothetical protein|nr:DUF192 domain-containing protein [Steroidobacteraceae bacterium]
MNESQSHPCYRAPKIAALAVLTVMAGAPALLRAQSAPPQDLATYPRTQLTVRPQSSPDKTLTFSVWVADTPARAEQGLMFVRDLPETMGMVFPLVPPRVENMWMKNTYIELDMLFVGADGKVTKIIERARPLSLDNLSSDKPVSAVLELRGGSAQRLGLKVGDRVSWKKS